MSARTAARGLPVDAVARRVLLAGCAGLLLTVPVMAHDTLNGRLVYGWVAVAVGLVVAVRALDSRARPGRRTTLIAGALCVALAVSTVALLLATLATPTADLRCRDDVSAATFGSAQELRAGHNPYESYDALKIESDWGCRHIAATVLRRGRFAQDTAIPPDADVQQAVRDAIDDPSRTEIERNLNYPGGTPVLGLTGTGAFPVLMAGLLIAGVAVTVRRATVDRRIAAVALAAQAALLSVIPDGHTDAAVVALLLIAWSSPTTTTGGLALGLAAGTKQTAWFLAPAFIATAYARNGWRAAASTTAGAAAGFAALNLPFVIAGPGDWLHGVTGPLVDGLFPLGAGLIGLVTSGTLPYSAVPAFTALMLATVALSVAAAVRLDRRFPGIGALLAALALFLGPRSLLEYLAGIGALLVCVVATAPQRAQTHPTAMPAPPRVAARAG